MVAVLPGVCETFANPLRLNSLLMSEDLPTLERPANDTSGKVDSGSWFETPNERSKETLLKMKAIFGVDLYEAGLAEKVCGYLQELAAGPGAVRATLKKYV